MIDENLGNSSEHQDRDALERRIDLMERENARLKKRLEDLGLGEGNPNFDAQAFQKTLAWYSRFIIVPFILIVPFFVAMERGWIPITNMMIGPIPLIDPGTRGLGLGVIAMGGLACGGIAFGGGAIGIVAVGGGAIGVFAMGGGAVGIFAIGGGAFGVFAIGGGAFGRYVLAGDGKGKYVFSLKRQDPEAVDFWVRLFPRFRQAVTSPLPVIPVDSENHEFNANLPQDRWS